MTETPNEIEQWLARWSAAPYAYLTTAGRRSGQPHRIEIWFATEGNTLFMMAGGRHRSDWVKNLIANPQVLVELGDETRVGTARIMEDGTTEDARTRDLLVAKYATPANPLADWKQRSLGVAVEFPNAEP